MTSADYQETIERFARLARQEAEIVHEAGASRLLAHGARTARAYVLLHGTTNSPAQWLEFASLLFDLGHNVYLPRAPYHGLRSRRVSELARLTAADLQSYALDAVAAGCGLGEELALIGVSGGATIAAWAAQNCPEINVTVLGMPFFNLYGLPERFSSPVRKLLGRLPDFALTRPGESHRSWVYRGQSTHGVAAYLALASDVTGKARGGAAPGGKIIILTTSRDRLANNGTTKRLAAAWRGLGAEVVQYHFPASANVPHNSADPAADPDSRRLFYQKIAALLEESPSALPGVAL